MGSKDVNKRAVENFIKAGAFDSLGGNRKQYIQVYEMLIDDVIAERKKLDSNQMTIFDMLPKEDKKAMEDATKLNSADAYAFMVEKTIRDLEDGKISEEQKKDIEEKIKAIKDAVNEKEVQKADDAVAELQKVWNPIAEGLYKNGGEDKQQDGGNQSNPFGGFNFGSESNPFSGK